VFANCLISFATWHVVPELRIKDCLSRYLEFLVIKIKAIITKLIALISLLYSHSSDVGSTVGVADCNFFIIGVFNCSCFVDRTSSYRLGVLLILSFTILVM
jgi:hypothetical protein